MDIRYQMRQGRIVCEEAESATVREIFNRYLQGESLQHITEALTAEGVRYHQHSSSWNKGMVKIEQIARSLESDANRDAVKELESLMIEAEDESSYAYFAVGFRWGARMMLSILTEGDTALMTEEENDNA